MNKPLLFLRSILLCHKKTPIEIDTISLIWLKTGIIIGDRNSLTPVSNLSSINVIKIRLTCICCIRAVFSLMDAESMVFWNVLLQNDVSWLRDVLYCNENFVINHIQPIIEWLIKNEDNGAIFIFLIRIF